EGKDEKPLTARPGRPPALTPAARRAFEWARAANNLQPLSDAIRAFAPRLRADEARTAAHLAHKTMANSSSPALLKVLSEAMSALGTRMDADEAATLAATAAQRTLKIMTRTRDPNDLQSLVRAVAALAERMKPDQAAAAARTASQRILEFEPTAGNPIQQR